MKKKFIILLVFLLILAASCFFTFNYFALPEPPASKIKKPEPTTPITEDLKGSFSNRGLKVDCSLAIQPLMNTYISYFANQDLLKKIQESYTDTEQALVKLINKETDLIITTHPSEENIKIASDAKIELDITEVVNDGLVFFVNSENKVNNLKVEDIVSIYSGNITTWNEVSGSNAEILAYRRPLNSSSEEGMKELVMRSTPMIKATTKEIVNSKGEIINSTAMYDNSINALGYAYYYYYYFMHNTKDTKLLKINDIEASTDNIADGTYPLLTKYYIITRKEASTEISTDATKLKEAILSNEGKRITKEAGYVPAKTK